MTPADRSEGLDLRHYLGVLRRRWVIIAAFVIFTAASAFGTSILHTKVYEAHSTLLIQQRAGDTLFNQSSGQSNDPTRRIETEMQVIESIPIRAAVQKKLGKDVPNAAAQSVAGTDVVDVVVQSTDPALAAAAASEYANAYIDFKRTQAVDDVLGAAQQIQQKITELKAQVAPLPVDSITREGLEQQVVLFQQQLDQLQVGAALRTGGAQLVAPAFEPTDPVEPKPLRNGLLGAAVGLLLGLGLALLVDHFDDRIRSKEEFEEIAGQMPVIGLVPSMPGWRKPTEEHLATVEMYASPVAESYRSVRTAIQFMGIEDPVKSIQITSAVPGEGKTTTAANLAVVFAHSGGRTVLIDCDLRRPRLHRFFGLSNEVGLTDVVLGKARLEEVVMPVEVNEHLWVIPAGSSTLNPSELLASSAFRRVLEAVEAASDFVIVDSPPILPVTDGLVVANRVAATILVATATQTTTRNTRRTLELLRQVGAPLAGAILNRVSEQEQYGYRRDNAYAYGPRKAADIEPEMPELPSRRR